jgi:hypothetical protein
LILLLSGTLVNANAQMMPTDITLEVSSSWVNLNDTVTFSGSLTNAQTGEGIAGQTITIYKMGPMGPLPFLTATTDEDGMYSVDWDAMLETNRNMPINLWAQFDGDGNALPSRTGKTTVTVALKPLELVLTTDSNVNAYSLGKKALFSVAFSDGAANFVDPDFVRATYDGKFVEMTQVDVGRYTFETSHLVKFEQHQFGVFAEKWGFKSAQKSTTITVFGVQDYKPMKVTAAKRGDDIRIVVRSSDLNANNVYTFVGTLVGGEATKGSATNWQFSIDHATNSFMFKTLEGYLAPGKSVTFKVKADGTPTQLLWKAFDLYGKEHSTIRAIAGSGATTVKPIRG